MHWKPILLAGLVSTLAALPGAACHQCPRMPDRPPKPTLVIEKMPDGGIRLDKENSVKLGNYILDLEAGYD